VCSCAPSARMPFALRSRFAVLSAAARISVQHTLPAADETRAAAETLGISDGVRRHGAQRERRVLLRLGRPRRL